MLAALEALRGEHDFSVEVRDVDSRVEWVALYDELVPVLLLGEAEICHYFLDVERLCKVLSGGASGLLSIEPA